MSPTILAALPDNGAPIYIICDNLSANITPAIRAWAARHNVELCLTPTNAPWANPIEVQFGPPRSFTLANSNHTVLSRRLGPICAGVTPTPDIPMSLPPNAMNAPVSAANASSAGADPPSPWPPARAHQPGERSWSAH